MSERRLHLSVVVSPLTASSRSRSHRYRHRAYEDPAFFRRLFKRLTGITPSAYRRKFRLPDFVHAGHGEPA